MTVKWCFASKFKEANSALHLLSVALFNFGVFPPILFEARCPFRFVWFKWQCESNSQSGRDGGAGWWGGGGSTL